MKKFPILILLLGILITIVGIINIITPAEEYKAPIYLSQGFRLEHRTNGEYYAIGEFANRTNKDVVISSISFKLYGDYYYAIATLRDITVPAGGKYYVNESVFNNPVDALKKITITSCMIDDVDWKLEYSKDGVTFFSSNKKEVSIIVLVVGIIFLLVSLYMCVTYFNKKKKIKY